MSDKISVPTLRHSFTKQAWMILIPSALIFGILLAYIFAPKLASFKEKKENPDSGIRYEIPVPENLPIPGHP